mmetsp:Transcript_161140/g.517179  ORF Transcript_161140/g.517179 Transcript_161140/m.517179 type:complete len:285 (-) Transcript_161140:199-1053(-)
MRARCGSGPACARSQVRLLGPHGPARAPGFRRRLPLARRRRAPGGRLVAQHRLGLRAATLCGGRPRLPQRELAGSRNRLGRSVLLCSGMQSIAAFKVALRALRRPILRSRASGSLRNVGLQETCCHQADLGCLQLGGCLGRFEWGLHRCRRGASLHVGSCGHLLVILGCVLAAPAVALAACGRPPVLAAPRLPETPRAGARRPPLLPVPRCWLPLGPRPCPRGPVLQSRGLGGGRRSFRPQRTGDFPARWSTRLGRAGARLPLAALRWLCRRAPGDELRHADAA